MTEPKTLIFQKIPLIMAEVQPISKSKTNHAQNYKFRGIDDVYQALQAIMAKHKVFTLPQVVEDRVEERLTKSGTNLIYRVLKIDYLFVAEDGSSVLTRVIGEGMDSGDKASNKAMAVAHKYALLQVFCIPTEEPKDPENDSQESSVRSEHESRPPVAKKNPSSNASGTSEETKADGQGQASFDSGSKIFEFSVGNEQDVKWLDWNLNERKLFRPELREYLLKALDGKKIKKASIDTYINAAIARMAAATLEQEAKK